MRVLPSRQIHLDFHTSPHIPDVGAAFDEKQFVETLKRARVNSVTLFAKCHHGLAYYDTKVGERHPNLKVDLLRRQYDACREAGIATPIYISIGWDELAADAHPEWLALQQDGSPYQMMEEEGPGWRFLDTGSGYLDYVYAQIEEVVTLFPEVDGLFLDIVKKLDSFSDDAQARMTKLGIDVGDAVARANYAESVFQQYLERSVAAARIHRPDLPVFHNQGFIMFGHADYLDHNSHIEIEALPTAGWGYDHFPLSAAYTSNLDKDYLGMTGKFHSCWGEMAGYKHPDALRYECALMNAFGAKCSIGDHLPPDGAIDQSSYDNIGKAFAEVESREPWFIDTRSKSKVGLVPVVASQTIASHELDHIILPPDIGASRILLEAQIPFDCIDLDMDWSQYDLVILPDQIEMSERLQSKLAAYTASGGKILATGDSGLSEAGNSLALDVGADYFGRSSMSSDYILPNPELMPDFAKSTLNMHCSSHRIKVTSGRSLGKVVEPYFNRTPNKFSGHLQTPPSADISEYDCAVENGAITYVAHPVFTAYHDTGALIVKEYVENIIKGILGGRLQFKGDLPDGARITVREQTDASALILSVVYALPQLRGKFRGQPIEVIQELPLFAETPVVLDVEHSVECVKLQPAGSDIPFSQDGNFLTFSIPAFRGSQLIEISYSKS